MPLIFVMKKFNFRIMLLKQSIFIITQVWVMLALMNYIQKTQ